MEQKNIVIYLKSLTELDDPVGDFAKDVFRDPDFPLEKTEKEIIKYLENVSERYGHDEIFKIIMKSYN